MAGTFHDPEYLRLARECVAFYNAWFPDNDSGAVYFNVLASGSPYLLGTERLKGSHSMSGYHSTELCYLAAVYTNLLLTKQPMDFYFKPKVDGPRDNILRVAPDFLPPGSVRLEAVWIDGQHHADFDPDGLTVRLPTVEEAPPGNPLKHRPPWMGDPRLLPAAGAASKKAHFDVRVRIVPAGLSFDMELGLESGIANLVLAGAFDDKAALALKAQLEKVITAQAKRLVLRADDVKGLSAACGRAISFARTKLGIDTDVYLIGANDQVKQTLLDVGVLEELIVQDRYDAESPPGSQGG